MCTHTHTFVDGRSFGGGGRRIWTNERVTNQRVILVFSICLKFEFATHFDQSCVRESDTYIYKVILLCDTHTNVAHTNESCRTRERAM